MSTRGTQLRRILTPLLTAIALLLIWEGADAIFDFNAIVLPTPTEIFFAFLQSAPRLFEETGITMFESVLGFLAGSIGAFLLAILFVHSRTAQDAIYPYAVALKSTPLIAIAPLLVLWFGNGVLSKIVMSALVAFFPVLVNSVNGLANIDAEAIDLMKSLSASRLQILLKIRIPASLPFVFAALKIASSLAVVGAVIGEFTGATQGIGHLIVTSSYYLETALMFAGVGLISLGGIVFFGVVAYLERRLVFWQTAS